MDKKNIRKKSKALSSTTRLNLIQLIGENQHTVSELETMYKKDYDGRTRETIYRELEKLVDAKILSKKYHKHRKKFFYSIDSKEINFKLL